MDDIRDEVPEAYLQWLRLVAAGCAQQDLAAELGVPVESLPTFSRLAACKLLRAAARERDQAG